MNRTTKSRARVRVSSVVVAVAVLISVLGCAKRAEPDPELVGALSLLENSDADNSVIQHFAGAAARGNVDEMLKSFDSSVRSSAGNATLREYLSTTVTPFFRDFDRVDSYVTVAGARFPDGRSGTVHYTYAVTKSGEMKPIMVALVREGSTTRIVNVTVGTCVPGRHPISEGRCDR